MIRMLTMGMFKVEPSAFMELRCSRDLALALGAIETKTPLLHRLFKGEGLHLLVRDERCRPLWWQWQVSKMDRAILIVPRSS